MPDLSLTQTIIISLAFVLIAIGLFVRSLRPIPQDDTLADGSETNASEYTPATKHYPTRAAAMKSALHPSYDAKRRGAAHQDEPDRAMKPWSPDEVEGLRSFYRDEDCEAQVAAFSRALEGPRPYQQREIDRFRESMDNDKLVRDAISQHAHLRTSQATTGPDMAFYDGPLGKPHDDLQYKVEDPDATRPGAWNGRFGDGRYGRLEGTGKHSEVL